MSTPAKRRLVKGTAAGAAAIALIGGFEGLRTVAYRDPVGIPTVCFGETRGVHMGDKYTVQQCKDMLGTRIGEFEDGMRACLKTPSLIPDGTYIAFVSFTYNVGVGTFCKSTARKLLDQGRYPEACDELPKFIYARGIPLPGLKIRRAQEREICKRFIPWS